MIDFLFKVIVGIISFTIIYYIFKRKNKDNPLKNWKFYLLWILTWIIIFLVISIGIVSFLVYKYTPASKNFNIEEWNNNTSKRNELINDLVKSKILGGKNRNEVIELLGTKEAYINNTNMIEYSICPGRSLLFTLDCERLIINFKNDKVESYNILEG